MSTSPVLSPSQPDAKRSTSTSTSPQPTTHAFLVHSQETLHNNLPPDIDNKPLARQKRRRTSKEDEEVLKAEYEKNPKPDKAIRLDIVRRVALGEKEVQIWFQNKRQNDRRRSRPSNLELSSDRVYSSLSDDQENTQNNNGSWTQDEAVSQEVSSGVVAESVQTSDVPPSSTATSNEHRADDTSFTDVTNSQPVFSSQESQFGGRGASGYLANRRNASFIKIHEDASPAPVASQEEETQPQDGKRTMTRSHSFIRLSMTVDGKAKVITEADQSPSPPRSQPINALPMPRSGSLRRSYSAAGLNDRFQDAAGHMRSPKLQRMSTTQGRSRDSRAWEFWCDSDARNSLAEKADQEGSGSAADAIGLIRANSRGPLRSVPNKRNTMLSRQSSSKYDKTHVTKKKRSSLVRSSTSQARLQTTTKQLNKPKKAGEETEEFEMPNTESDKENWKPESNSNRQRRTQSHNLQSSQRQILGENTQILSQSSSLSAMMARERRTNAKSHFAAKNTDAENINPDDDDEIALFMGSARPGSGGTSSVSSGEELGCVQGLLKLSQGNWR